MATERSSSTSGVEAAVHRIAHEGVELPDADAPRGGESNPFWSRLRELGTELWLDTGDLDEADRLWSAEFTALTTNNTLLSKEVGKGIYDDLVRRSATTLRAEDPGLSEDALVREIGLVLNAHHGLRLVERFGCKVSVELHTDLAFDLEGTLAAGRRLYAVCPSHFIVKVPLSPSGVLASRRLVADGIPINFTLEFSARQNHLAALIGRPDYVNVFLGRLNSFVADEGLGDGRMVGEKATLASQRELLALRDAGGRTRQIAASMREAELLRSLAGVDVYTMPIGVAEGMSALGASPESLAPRVADDPAVTFGDGVSAESAGLHVLWEVSPSFKDTVATLAGESLEDFDGEDLAGFLHERGHGDVFPHSLEPSDLDHIAADGKLPSYARWKDRLGEGEVGLDALFNAAGMASFAADQKALDDRVRSLVGG